MRKVYTGYFYKFYSTPGVILSVLLLLLVSCGDDGPADSSPELPVITRIDPQPTYARAVISIYGTSFGAVNDSSVVRINDIEIRSRSCIRWENKLIRLEIPFGAQSGKITVETPKGESPGFDLLIGAFPPFEMITVPAGEFLMGSETGYDDEKPVHTVTITDSFEISKYEIPCSVWRAAVSTDKITFDGDGLPVNNISWTEAALFCNRISVLSGLDSCYVFEGGMITWNKTANGYRLPTEAEWEYACRAGTTGKFAGTGFLDEMGWFSSNSGNNCQPSGLKKPNAFGIYDMHGNVWEWCWDYYDSGYYSTSPQINPSGPAEGQRRVARGGSFADGNIYLRSSNRKYDNIDNIYCGLRIVRNKFE